MPDREVKTIRDLIYYQYAKIIAKSALGPDAKKTAYAFIKAKFRELRDNNIFAKDILIPKGKFETFYEKGIFTFDSIRNFADKIGISLAIVAG